MELLSLIEQYRMFQSNFRLFYRMRRRKKPVTQLSDGDIESLKLAFTSKRKSEMTTITSEECASVSAPSSSMLRRKKRGHRGEVTLQEIAF